MLVGGGVEARQWSRLVVEREIVANQQSSSIIDSGGRGE